MSSDIRPWPISQACRKQSARLGFDPDTPEQMVAVRNAEAEALLALINGAASQNPIRSRLKLGAALAALLAAAPDTAAAEFAAAPEPFCAPVAASFPPDPPAWAPNLSISDAGEKEAGGDVSPVAVIEPLRGDHHPPLIIRPSASPAAPTLTTEPKAAASEASLLLALWRSLPELLLAGAAWLIWRELRALRRNAAPDDIKEAPKHEEDEMNDESEDDQALVATESPWRVLVGGASRCGQVRAENQDAYAVREVAEGVALAITCDGVGGRPGGRTAARYCSRKLKARAGMGLTVGLSAEDAVFDALDHCAEQMAEDGIEGLTTALIALVEGDRLTWAGLGDGRICLIHPDGMAQDLMAPHHAPNLPANVITAHLEAGRRFTPRRGALRLEPGALVLTMSDGAGDLLDLQGLAKRHKQLVAQLRQTGPEIFCDDLLSHLEGLTDPKTGQPLHGDNLTLTVTLLDHEGDAA